MKKRFAAVLCAAIVASLGIVAVAANPAQSDPPPYITDCYRQLTTCGYPTRDTVGVVDALTPYEGVIETTEDEQVIENLEITGCIVVRNADVVIHNVRILSDCFYGVGRAVGGSYTMSDSEVTCTAHNDTGIELWYADVTRVLVEGCVNAVGVTEYASLTDSVLMAWEASDEDHGDLVQAFPGSNVYIHHNLFAAYNPMTSSLITVATGIAAPWEFSDNFIGGGAYTVYCPDDTDGFVFTGNRFYGLSENPSTDMRSATYGLTDACDVDNDITWSDNRSDFDGSTVNNDGTTTP